MAVHYTTAAPRQLHLFRLTLSSGLPEGVSSRQGGLLKTGSIVHYFADEVVIESLYEACTDAYRLKYNVFESNARDKPLQNETHLDTADSTSVVLHTDVLFQN